MFMAANRRILNHVSLIRSKFLSACSPKLLLCETNFRDQVSLTATISVSSRPESTNIYLTCSHNVHFLTPLYPSIQQSRSETSILSGS